jgi:16S rRNA G966 N2-methylase RsmD
MGLPAASMPPRLSGLHARRFSRQTERQGIPEMAKKKRDTLFDSHSDRPDQGPVECLGMTFPNDEARRAHFTAILREKLKDPEFRKIEGFPIGDDEAILEMSDPPYYTACPNPFIADLITQNIATKQTAYKCGPFAADVSEGKNDPIYSLHTYHTKVPHKVVMRYILHYTQPGDIILDGFCGTGMAGVAAQLCGDRREIESLGYAVSQAGVVSDAKGIQFSMTGERRAVLSDLSPCASLIAHNYCNLADLNGFQEEAINIANKIEHQLSWLFSTDRGRFVNAIWSDVFLCPECGHELVFWKAAILKGKLQGSFPCPHCRAVVGKAVSKATGATKLERAFETRYDPFLKKTVKTPKWVIVEQSFKGKSTHVITAEHATADLFRLISEHDLPPVPSAEFFPGRQTNKLINGSGITHIPHMYSPRALCAYAMLWQQRLSTPSRTSLFRYCLSAINNYVSRKQGKFGGGGGVSGTLFTPSIHLERNLFDVLKRKLKSVGNLKYSFKRNATVTTQSVGCLTNIPSESIDYIFTDPPFGESLQYAELNCFVEAWLAVQTARQQDCVLNYVHRKDLNFYSQLMTRAFCEYARVLKAGRWITVEFHNSQNAVWNVIQQSIEVAGFVVADVRVLDKQQRGFNAVNRAGAVDKDLVITAYKPSIRFRREISSVEGGLEAGVWSFVANHLAQLPVFVETNGKAEILSERQKHLLFDRMVAFHLRNGFTITVSASEFYDGLRERFVERDGMFFLREQVAEYDEKRHLVGGVEQLQLFVSDEKSAIAWVRSQLLREPCSFKELQPLFMKEAQQIWERHEQPVELRAILEQNFVESVDGLWYVPDPQNEAHLEQIRHRALCKEFQRYLDTKGKLRIVRTEALRAGFKESWQKKDYTTIVKMAKRVPDAVIQEDQALLMYFDNASLMLGE